MDTEMNTENVEFQTFNILVDGVEKNAEVLKVFELDDRKYVVYTIVADDDFSDVFASEVVEDSEGNDVLVDIEDDEIRKNVLEIVNIIFS